jgi:Protein of unknown function (DUF1501)
LLHQVKYLPFATFLSHPTTFPAIYTRVPSPVPPATSPQKHVTEIRASSSVHGWHPTYPDTTVIAWGEFGRTPRINKDAGRDHWPNVSCALLAGGGMRTGQVIGATDRLGGEAVSRPVTFQEVISTLYHNLGINATTTTLPDLTGRPHYLVDDNYQPLPELV